MTSRTIFITISRGGTARNILQTDAFRLLRESGARLVILSPAWQDERFRRTFGYPGVEFAPLYEPPWSFWDYLFVGLHKALVYNASTEMRDRYGIYSPDEANVLRYWAKRLVFRPLRNIGALKEWARALDAAVIRDRHYGELFSRYRPAAVFSTSVIEDMDVAVQKQARARGVPIIAMPKSWDNLSKISCRVKPDRLLVWGPYSEEEAARFQNIPSAEVEICGIPQFDLYSRPEIFVSREEFCRAFALDPQKKIILYASEGKVAKHDPEMVLMLARAAAARTLGAPAQILIRPHFIYPGDKEKFASVASLPGVFIDNFYQPSACFRDRWDYSVEQMKHLANLLHHADVLVTSNSTLTLDASAMDKPTVNVAFDGREKKPFTASIAKWYTTEYYRQVVATGAPWLVGSEEELLAAVRALLADPSIRRAERRRLADYFCGPRDGRAGERVGQAVIEFVNGV
ncbi:hypothetical protein EPN90_03015 [Patescibacteria group bacterium]|nr:MAG: hypothetical protein EPN90_03015 [Patescibacteria group bacterium]